MGDGKGHKGRAMGDLECVAPTAQCSPHSFYRYSHLYGADSKEETGNGGGQRHPHGLNAEAASSMKSASVTSRWDRPPQSCVLSVILTVL